MSGDQVASGALSARGRFVARFAALAAWFLISCYGGVDGKGPGGGDADDGGDDGNGDGGSVEELCMGDPSPGEAPLRRLTNFEYDNTVRDLLGDASEPALAFVPDAGATAFDTQTAVLPISQLLAEQYMSAAETLAATAAADLGGLVPCDPTAMGESACGLQFIESFGRRAFRRPLDPDDIDTYGRLFADSLDQFDFQTAVELVVSAMLQSPSFLYRLEFGGGSVQGDAVALDGYEVASRLSYLIWGSMPDEELLAHAEAGQLSSPDEVAAQAWRMLDDAKARAAVTEFHAQWLLIHEVDNLTKDTGAYPSYTDEVRTESQAETRAFVDHVVFDGAGDLATLLTADYSIMGDALAGFYGVVAPAGNGPNRVDLDPGRASGVLTHSSFLAVHGKADQSSPVLRGKFIRERVLCQPLPQPPADVDTNLPDIAPGVTTRERLEQHSTDPACSGCHVLIDPIGLGFEHYDGVGLYRDRDQGQPVDASGELIGTRDADGTFDGVDELGQRLASSEEVSECFVRQWFRFAHARVETADDACSLALLDDTFIASERNIRELIVALTQTPAFAFRSSIDPVGGGG